MAKYILESSESALEPATEGPKPAKLLKLLNIKHICSRRSLHTVELAIFPHHYTVVREWITLPALHIHFIYSSHTLHLHFIYTSPLLHIHFTYTLHTLHLSFTFTSYTLHIHFTYTSYTLHQHFTYTSYTLHRHLPTLHIHFHHV